MAAAVDSLRACGSAGGNFMESILLFGAAILGQMFDPVVAVVGLTGGAVCRNGRELRVTAAALGVINAVAISLLRDNAGLPLSPRIALAAAAAAAAFVAVGYLARRACRMSRS